VRSILIIQTAFLGDVILATAAIEQARSLFPSASIDVVVKRGNETLLERHPYIREVFTFDKKRSKFREIMRFRRLFSTRDYDIAFNFHRFASSGILTLISGAKKTYGFRKNPFSIFFTKRFKHKIDGSSHEIDRNFQLFAEFHPQVKHTPKLYPPKESWIKTAQFKQKPYYCIAPASVWATKQLPIYKWAELIMRMETAYTIYLLGSPHDSELCQQIITRIDHLPKVKNLAGKLTLLDTATLMHDAVRNFVNDSAPLHIASAMNAPVTAFFCSTIPQFGFGPLSENQQILEVENLSCRPCGLHGHRNCPKKHFQCGEIDLHTVILHSESC